jgi:hypothetical protein
MVRTVHQSGAIEEIAQAIQEASMATRDTAREISDTAKDLRDSGIVGDCCCKRNKVGTSDNRHTEGDCAGNSSGRSSDSRDSKGRCSENKLNRQKKEGQSYKIKLIQSKKAR